MMGQLRTVVASGGGDEDSLGRSARKLSGGDGLFCFGIGVWMAWGSYAFVTIPFSAFPQKEIILKGWEWDTLQLFFKRMRWLWTDLKRMSWYSNWKISMVQSKVSGMISILFRRKRKERRRGRVGRERKEGGGEGIWAPTPWICLLVLL